GKPYEGKRFILNIGEREIKGETTSRGMVDVEVPVTESTARLRVWLLHDAEDAPPTIDRDLSIGHIDPIDMISGVQGRLSNLGYACLITNEVNGPLLFAARSFRARHGLPEIEGPKDDETVETYADRLLDDAFRKKLVVAYGSKDAS